MNSPCEVQGSQAMSDHIANQYASRMEALSNDLLHGTLSLEDWHAHMQDAIRLAFIHQAVAGTGDLDEREITSSDMKRIEGDIAKQYQYLDGFASDIEAAIEKEGASLDFIPNRATLYAGSSGAEYWKQATDVDLPAMPRDGQTRCNGRCQCSWSLDCDSEGNVLATWNLGDADSCPDCEANAKQWNPLVIPAKGD